MLNRKTTAPVPPVTAREEVPATPVEQPVAEPITGQVTGALLVGASMGGMLLPWLIGQLFASRGPGVLPATMMAVLIAAMAIFVVAMGWAARQPTTEKLS